MKACLKVVWSQKVFHLGLNLKKKGLNHCPEYLLFRWIVLRAVMRRNFKWGKIFFTILFVCNRGDTYYSITEGSRQESLAKPLSLLGLTPRPVLSSHQHRTLVCLFWSGNLHFAHSPANPTSACQECFELLDVSNSANYSFSNT